MLALWRDDMRTLLTAPFKLVHPHKLLSCCFIIEQCRSLDSGDFSPPYFRRRRITTKLLGLGAKDMK